MKLPSELGSSLEIVKEWTIHHVPHRDRNGVCDRHNLLSIGTERERAEPAAADINELRLPAGIDLPQPHVTVVRARCQPHPVWRKGEARKGAFKAGERANEVVRLQVPQLHHTVEPCRQVAAIVRELQRRESFFLSW